MQVLEAGEEGMGRRSSKSAVEAHRGEEVPCVQSWNQSPLNWFLWLSRPFSAFFQGLLIAIRTSLLWLIIIIIIAIISKRFFSTVFSFIFCFGFILLCGFHLLCLFVQVIWFYNFQIFLCVCHVVTFKVNLLGANRALDDSTSAWISMRFEILPFRTKFLLQMSQRQ